VKSLGLLVILLITLIASGSIASATGPVEAASSTVIVKTIEPQASSALDNSIEATNQGGLLKEQPRSFSEAERCEAKLMQIHQKSLADKLQIEVWNKENIDKAIEDMKAAQQIKDAEAENLIRFQLTLGSILVSEGLLHEAVYQVFKARYKSKSEIADALQNFKNISLLKTKLLLLSEVIERVLQYIPDVDEKNVNQIKETARFIRMNQDQIQSFREKWLLYDQMNNFVEIMQGGILALLTNSSDKFVQDVLSRGSITNSFYRIFLPWRAIKFPNTPLVHNETLNIRQIRVENQQYYDTNSLDHYLEKSSPAARRFFIMDRIEHFTIEQLKSMVEKKEEYWLKKSLVQTLQDEIQWRLILKEKFEILVDHQRDLHEIEVTIARLKNRLPYDARAFQSQLNGLRTDDAGTITPDMVTTQSVALLDSYAVSCDSVHYINVLSKIIAASNVALLQGGQKNVLPVIEAAVRNINSLGMIEEHANKTKRMLADLGAKLSGNGPGKVNEILDKLDTRTPKYAKLTLEQLEAELITVSNQVSTASTTLEQAYSRP